MDPLKPDLSWPDTIFSSIRSGTGPGAARHLSFSNHSDRFAYIGIESHVWVSDYLGFEEIDTGVQLDYSKNPLEVPIREELIWTPDDQHLIIASEEQNWIYHVQDQKIEEWAYQCDQVALSPESSRLAIWCEGGEGIEQYAVIEWGGDVWYSETALGRILLKTTTPENQDYRKVFSLYSAAAWSSDGQKFAFFYPEGDNHLIIVNAQGEPEQRLNFQGIRWKKMDFLTIERPVQWSNDTQDLLLYGYEPNDQQCYSEENALLSELDLLTSCWQVMDSETGTVKWLPAFGEREVYMAADQAASSVDGRWLALANRIPSYYALTIVDLDSYKTLVTTARVHSFAWGIE